LSKCAKLKWINYIIKILIFNTIDIARLLKMDLGVFKKKSSSL